MPLLPDLEKHWTSKWPLHYLEVSHRKVKGMLEDVAMSTEDCAFDPQKLRALPNQNSLLATTSALHVSMGIGINNPTIACNPLCLLEQTAAIQCGKEDAT